MSTQNWNVRPMVLTGLITLGVLIGGFGGWAVVAEMGGAVVAGGRIEVEQNRQVVQHPYGGAVKEILIDEGDIVTAGQVLLRLDDKELRSELIIVQGQLSEVIARRDRLMAERDNAEVVSFDPELADATEPEVQALIAGQTRLFETRRANIATAIEQYQRRNDQILDQIAGTNAQQASLVRQIDLIQKELVDQQSLLDRGLAQAARVLALQRELASLEGQQGELAAAVAQAEGRITENNLAILGIQTTRQEEAISQLRDLQPTEVELRERRTTIVNRLDSLEIKAPVSGVIYGLEVYSTSAVVQPAQPLLFIVPQDRPLVISTQIQPRDIDQIRVNQEVRLRFSAFDQRRSPELLGRIVTISADAFEDQATRMSFYRAEIKLDDGELDKLPPEMVLMPGMPVEAFVRTGDRTPAEFLIKPMADFFARAFRES